MQKGLSWSPGGKCGLPKIGESVELLEDRGVVLHTEEHTCVGPTVG